MGDDSITEERVKLNYGYPCTVCDPGSERGERYGPTGVWGIVAWQNPFPRADGCPDHFPEKYTETNEMWAYFDDSNDPPYMVPKSWLHSTYQDPFTVFAKKVIRDRAKREG